MAQMIRKQIYIHKRQQALLKRLARMRGVSEAEIIRQAIDRQEEAGIGQSAPHDHAGWEEALRVALALRALGPLENRPRDWKREDLYEERVGRYARRSD